MIRVALRRLLARFTPASKPDTGDLELRDELWDARQDIVWLRAQLDAAVQAAAKLDRSAGTISLDELERAWRDSTGSRDSREVAAFGRMAADDLLREHHIDLSDRRDAETVTRALAYVLSRARGCCDDHLAQSVVAGCTITQAAAARHMFAGKEDSDG